MAIETIALVALGTAAAGGAVSAYGAYQQGQANSRSAAYQAAVARNNEILAGQYAQAETVKAQRMEETKRMETAQRTGSVRAAAGANGLDVNSGSPLLLQEDTAKLGEFDALTIRNAGARAAYGYKVQGMNYAAQATLDDMQAADAARGGALGAFSSLIGGASSVSDKWTNFRTRGVFGG